MHLLRSTTFFLSLTLATALQAQPVDVTSQRVRNLQSNGSVRGGDTQIPYPILYVHGLVGSSASWQEMSDWLADAIGDPVDLEFCLNADGSLYSSDAADDIESFIPSNLESVNQYIINFNCNASGTCSTTGSLSSQSNQSGIYKQAEAIGMAIEAILGATGKAKVILLGHSMGGVACRQYLQNSDHWSFSTHRVAKLITSGSPHVGFDLGSKLAKWPGLFQDIDPDSEAIRDLKNTHTGLLTWTPGVFFWGGEEDQDYMYDDIFYWWNVDVNCNGITGEQVEGLNERSMYIDLEFASIFDTFDLVVTPESVEWNPLGGTTGGEDLCSVLANGWSGDFHCESWGWNVPAGDIGDIGDYDVTGGHQALTKQLCQTLWALDEADDYENSYEVALNEWYTGFLTTQSSADDGYEGYSGPYASDWDDFIVNIPLSGGTLNIFAEFDQVSQGADFLLYEISSGEYINWIENVGDTEILSTSVDGGQYIIEFNHEITSATCFGQYFFQVTLDQVNSIETAELEAALSVWPNPASHSIQLDFKGSDESIQEIRMIDAQGREFPIDLTRMNNTLNISAFPCGSYTLVVTTQNSVYTTRLVIQ